MYSPAESEVGIDIIGTVGALSPEPSSLEVAWQSVVMSSMVWTLFAKAFVVKSQTGH